MGVSGLTCLVQNYYPQVKKRVSIKSLADAHRRLHSVDTPILLIDGINFIDPLCEDLDWTFGGQWLEFCQRIEEFTTKWTAIGVKPVFVFDGAIAPDKVQTWISRRNDGVRKVHEMFTKMDSAFNDNERRRILQQEKLPLRGRGTFTGFYLRNNCASDVYLCFEDTDKDLASFAKNDERCFAILSNDTDFFIFDTKMVLSARDLDLNNMTTILYDKQLLMQLLGVRQVSHMPMYACMMGNDVITTNSLRPFHEKIAGRRWKDFKMRSDAVCQELPKLVGQSYEQTSFYVFGNKSYAKSLKVAVEGYALTNSSALLNFDMSLITVDLSRPSYIESRLWNQIVSSCMRAESSPDVFGVLRFKLFKSAETIEHQGVHAFSGSLFKQVRQRTYYLLFKHLVESGQDGIPDVVIQECIASPGQRMSDVSPVRPLKINLSADVPTLDHVLFGSDDNLKLKLFLSCFNIP